MDLWMNGTLAYVHPIMIEGVRVNLVEHYDVPDEVSQYGDALVRRVDWR